MSILRLLVACEVAVAAASCGGAAAAPSGPTVATFTLNGQITDSATRGGIVGATVTIADGPNAGKSSTTDSSGSYRIPALQQSGFTLTVSATNYHSATKSVTLTSDQTVSLQLVRSELIVDGVWVGPWTRTSCVDTGSLAGFCALFNAGTMTLTLQQTGTTVQGTLTGLGETPLSVLGFVDFNGELHVTGQGGTLGGNPIALISWQSRISGNAMSGSFVWIMTDRSTSSSGTATVTVTMGPLIRVG